MKLFNAIQIVAIHAAAPFLIGMIPSLVGQYAAWAFYVALSLVLIGATYTAIEEWDR